MRGNKRPIGQPPLLNNDGPNCDRGRKDNDRGRSNGNARRKLHRDDRVLL
jgi:hypothetical protein